MRRFFTAVLEQGNSYSQDFTTEPFEAGWATEARWFIRILGADGTHPGIEAFPQISPDGLCWCDADDVEEPALLLANVPEPTMVSFKQREFGNWLRLRVRLVGERPEVKLLIYLALKE